MELDICPQIASGNTNAQAIMLGERGADLILGQLLPALTAPETASLVPAPLALAETRR